MHVDSVTFFRILNSTTTEEVTFWFLRTHGNPVIKQASYLLLFVDFWYLTSLFYCDALLLLAGLRATAAGPASWHTTQTTRGSARASAAPAAARRSRGEAKET
jgi:hypothetical protein